VYFAAYPRFSELVELKDDDKLRSAFHTSCQYMAILVMPFMATIAGLSGVFLHAWNGTVLPYKDLPIILSLLVIGWGLNGLTLTPYALQLAHGWTKLTTTFYAVLVCIQVPVLIVLTKYFGGIGAASVWAGSNVIILLIVPFVMFGRILPKAKWQWLTQDLILPMIVSTISVCAFRFFEPNMLSRFDSIVYISVAYIISVICTGLFLSDIRSVVLKLFRRLKPETA
jgi:O-antigen/teichoic acid export membrane protein